MKDQPVKDRKPYSYWKELTQNIMVSMGVIVRTSNQAQALCVAARKMGLQFRRKRSEKGYVMTRMI